MERILRNSDCESCNKSLFCFVLEVSGSFFLVFLNALKNLCKFRLPRDFLVVSSNFYRKELVLELVKQIYGSSTHPCG